MGIQDDYFDVKDELKGNRFEKAFDRIWAWGCRLEEENENLNQYRGAVLGLFRAVKQDKDLHDAST